MTWVRLDAEVDATAASLRSQLGLAPGDRVALTLSNTPVFATAYFAILRAGLVAVPLNPGYTSTERAQLLGESDAKASRSLGASSRCSRSAQATYAGRRRPRWRTATGHLGRRGPRGPVVHLRHLMVSGAARLPPAVLEQIRSETGIMIREGYGMTETAPVVTSTLGSPRVKPGSIGRPVPGVEVRLVDEASVSSVGGHPA